MDTAGGVVDMNRPSPRRILVAIAVVMEAGPPDSLDKLEAFQKRLLLK